MIMDLESLVTLASKDAHQLCCDNPCVKIRGSEETMPMLAMAIGMAMTNSKAASILVSPKSLTFYWHHDVTVEGIKPLPMPLSPILVLHTVMDWLKEADYGEEPDHDGSNTKGWYLETGDDWGHIDDSPYSIFRITTDWVMHGK